MDVRLHNLGFTANPRSNAFKNLCNPVQIGGAGDVVYCAADTTLRLNSSGFAAFSPSALKGVKRKWNFVDDMVNLNAESSLCLNLGHSSSSSDSKGSLATVCASVSSAKETEEESPMDLELDFTLHLGSDKSSDVEKSAGSNLKSLNEVDLQLSLSSGLTVSDITTVHPNTTAPKRLAKMVTDCGGLNMDEGSTGNPFMPLPTEQSTQNVYFLNQGKVKPKSPGPSPSIITTPKSSVTCTSGITQPKQQRSNSTKQCRFQGCLKGGGVSLDLMDDAMNVFKEFFATPAEYKATYYSTNASKKCRIFSSTLNYDIEKVHYWRDNFTHHCHPLEDHIHFWPDKPARYRDVIGKYSVEVRKLMLGILDIIGEDLQLQPGYFNNQLISSQLVSTNHHIPCPDPSLTLGMPQHCDPNILTVLQQCSTPGFQVFRHGEWMDVHPVPDAFIIIPGLQLKVISNGKFSSPIHRVMTHTKEARTTIGTFLNPSMDALIEPAKENIGATSPIYRSYTYKEFYETFVEARADGNATLECFQTIKK